MMSNLESTNNEESLNVESLKPNEISNDSVDSLALDSLQEEGDLGSEAISTNETTEVETEKRSSPRESFEKFLKDVELQADVDAKLQFVIDFMEASIAQSGSPRFKDFWEARNVCLSLFKENVSPLLRGSLWTKYNDLSKEARRLKDIFDEQSAFAVEQIEIAVAALEADLQSVDDQMQKIPEVDFNVEGAFLNDQLSKYKQIQRELNLLNTQASRINALRKELIRIEMRVKLKNKFFQRLSVAGDHVFPRRKDLIKQVSDFFISDVDSFIESRFKAQDQKESLFSLREEIKGLQNMAKLLTLNTHSFSQTRMRLSECWDQLKGEEKERKKERSQIKAHLKQAFTAAIEKLQAFKAAYEAEEINFAEASKQIEALGVEFRNLELIREDRQQLKDTFIAVRKPLLDKVQAEELAHLNEEKQRKEHQRNLVIAVRQQISDLLQRAQSLDVDTLTAERDAVIEAISSSPAIKAEKIEMERQLKPLRDIIVEKKESALLALSDDDRESLKQLREVLRQRKERRQAIKDQIDAYRKNTGRSSGFDFDQAFNSNQLMTAEKERLEKINQSIKEIEATITQLELSVSG